MLPSSDSRACHSNPGQLKTQGLVLLACLGHRSEVTVPSNDTQTIVPNKPPKVQKPTMGQAPPQGQNPVEAIRLVISHLLSPQGHRLATLCPVSLQGSPQVPRGSCTAKKPF